MNEYLNKLINYIKKYPIKCICFILLLGLLVPLFIQIPYWIGKYYLLINTDFKASDILSFWGNFLTFIATTGLGVLALWQNKIIQDKANDENKKLQEQNNKLREQDVERYRLECMSKYYSNVIFCDGVQISTNYSLHDTQNDEKYFQQVLYHQNISDRSGGQCIEIKFILKPLNQYVPKSIRIECIALHYCGCYRKDEDDIIVDGKKLNVLSRNKYFSPLNINIEERFKISAILCINNFLCQKDIEDYIAFKGEDIVKEIEKSPQIFIVIGVSVKNPFNIITNASYIISLKNTNEIENNKFLKFKVDDVIMQLTELNIEE